MHYVRGRRKNAVASWGCPVAPDNSTLRRHQEHPEEFGDAFSDGFREKRTGGLRQMPLQEYAEKQEFHSTEKCNECYKDVDPLDSSGVNQDIDEYLNYVLANGYLRPDLCKNIGIKELLSPHKCKTSSGNTAYHCGHCCKGKPKSNDSETNSNKDKKQSLSSSSYRTAGGLNCSNIFQSQKRSSQSVSGKSRSLSELAKQAKQCADIQKETQSSPSTENTLMQPTHASPAKDTVKRTCFYLENDDENVRLGSKSSSRDNCIMTTSPSTSIGLKRDTCPCSPGGDFVRVTSSPKNCKETGL